MKSAEDVAKELAELMIEGYGSDDDIAKALTQYAEERVKEAFNQPTTITLQVNQISHLQQQARAEALEEAAKVVADWPGPGGIIMVDDINSPTGLMNGLRDGILTAIRALKDLQ